MTRFCSESNCGVRHIARGLCSRHYQNARKHGLPAVQVRGRVCDVAHWGRKHFAGGLCSMHSQRKRKGGSLQKRTMRGEPLVERIMAKVRKVESGCWIFTGGLQGRGYGHIRGENRKMVVAHLALYRALKGPVANGLELDHICRVRACVNPDHLEQVTHQENVRRGLAGHDWPTRNRNSMGQFTS